MLKTEISSLVSLRGENAFYFHNREDEKLYSLFTYHVSDKRTGIDMKNWGGHGAIESIFRQNRPKKTSCFTRLSKAILSAISR